MHKTKEIRWFFRYNIESVVSWFDNLPFNVLEYRTDHYLKLNKDDVGIKLSDENIEIKQRIGSRAKGCLNQNIWGYYDHFIKWSFNASADIQLVSDIRNEEFENWLPVKKERKLAQLVTENGKTIITPKSVIVDSGCQVEYSLLTIGGEKWYTFGLEWFGNNCVKLETLITTKILGKTKLNMAKSKGYAAFLSKFIQNHYSHKVPIHPIAFSN